VSERTWTFRPWRHVQELIAANYEMRRAIAEGEADLAAGRVRFYEEVRKELGLGSTGRAMLTPATPDVAQTDRREKL
jgi:hypothetical protein